MKRATSSLKLILIVFLFSCTHKKDDLKLWFNKPAQKWTEALPIGNGKLGAMIFGGTSTDRIQLNEESIWIKRETYKDNPMGAKKINELRQLLLNNQYKKADELSEKYLMTERISDDKLSYQTLGNLIVNYSNIGKPNKYSRDLNISQAIASTNFSSDAIEYKREIFASAPDNLIVYKSTASKSGKISCSIEFNRPGEGEVITTDKNQLIVRQHTGDGNGVKYEARFIVLNKGGELVAKNKRIEVSNADEIEIRMICATDYLGKSPEKQVAKTITNSQSKSFVEIKNNHIQEYKKWFDRVEFKLPVTEKNNLPTDERLALKKNGSLDPSLSTLYFQFGRYLLISCSRPNCLPANLQGLWEEGLTPPWKADYHTNINLQMNYWLAESCNLSELHMPLIDFVDKLQENGEKTAKTLYNCRGFVAHHVSDAWHCTSAIGKTKWGMWPMGGAWCATHAWEHYLFTLDQNFLKTKAYPILKNASLFMSDYLFKNPRTGKLVTGPSMSPENRFYAPDGSILATCLAPAMDIQIITHLFNSTIEAAKVLEVGNDELIVKIKEQLKQLSPVKIGKDGRILEWSSEEFKEAEKGHRHMSHLYGMFPGNLYNWENTPDFMKASEKVIKERLKHGGGHTGWSRAWMTNFYARLLQPQKAYESLQLLYKKSTLPNMFDNHPPFQIDGNFGATAAMAEMLVQSHNKKIDILPCLPKEWHTGSINGLVARGGFVVDIKWEKEKLSSLKITAKVDNKTQIQYQKITKNISLKKGESITLNSELE